MTLPAILPLIVACLPVKLTWSRQNIQRVVNHNVLEQNNHTKSSSWQQKNHKDIWESFKLNKVLHAAINDFQKENFQAQFDRFSQKSTLFDGFPSLYALVCNYAGSINPNGRGQELLVLTFWSWEAVLSKWNLRSPSGRIFPSASSSLIPDGLLGVCSVLHPCSDSEVSSRHINWERKAFSFRQLFDKRLQSVKSDETARDIICFFLPSTSNLSRGRGEIVAFWSRFGISLSLPHIHPDTWDLYQNSGDLPEWSKDQIHFWPSCV